MDDAERDGDGPRRRSGAGRRVVLAGGGMLLAGVLGLWVERRPIAARVIDRELARRGVPAHYRIEDLGLGRQRLIDVVIGDPRAPDLTADWIEADTRIGLDGASVTGLHAGHVRARARWRDGRLSLGSIDRLLPASTGRAFRLPALDLDVADARARLDLPQGMVNLSIAGSGRLDGGFRGTVGVSSGHLAAAGCVVDRAAATMRVSVERARPHLQGPVRASAASCGGVRARALASDLALTLEPALDSWTGQARLAAGGVAHPAALLADLTGAIGFGGGPNGMRGVLDLAAARFAAADASGRALALRGTYLIDRAGMSLGGSSGARLSAGKGGSRRNGFAYSIAGPGLARGPRSRRCSGDGRRPRGPRAGGSSSPPHLPPAQTGADKGWPCRGSKRHPRAVRARAGSAIRVWSGLTAAWLRSRVGSAWAVVACPWRPCGSPRPCPARSQVSPACSLMRPTEPRSRSRRCASPWQAGAGGW